tara:strand:- start:246 stop:554 length:309 start_codon:yes stop_codon:yes gene_type:complete
MKNLNVIVIMCLALFITQKVQAEGLFDGPDLFSNDNAPSETTSIWKSDGSLVIIQNAEDAGYIVKGTDEGTDIEYYVKPKADGSPTFIYDDELLICSTTGCY